MEISSLILDIELSSHIVDGDPALGQRIGARDNIAPLDVATCASRLHLLALIGENKARSAGREHEENAAG